MIVVRLQFHVKGAAPCYVHLDKFLARAQLSVFCFGSVLLTYSVLACSRPAEDPPKPSKFLDYLPVALYCMTTVATLFLLLLCFTDGWIVPAPGVGPGSVRRLVSGCPLLLW
jgi:hypothetical protein